MALGHLIDRVKATKTGNQQRRELHSFGYSTRLEGNLFPQNQGSLAATSFPLAILRVKAKFGRRGI